MIVGTLCNKSMATRPKFPCLALQCAPCWVQSLFPACTCRILQREHTPPRLAIWLCRSCRCIWLAGRSFINSPFYFFSMNSITSSKSDKKLSWVGFTNTSGFNPPGELLAHALITLRWATPNQIP